MGFLNPYKVCKASFEYPLWPSSITTSGRINRSTKYKQKLLDLCSDMFTWENIITAGELELVYDPATTVTCALVYQDHWQSDLAGIVRAV
jgi:hypothetical protein